MEARMAKKKLPEGIIVLTNVRISYAKLFKPDTKFGNYGLVALMEKGDEQGEANLKKVRGAMNKAAKKEWPTNTPKLKPAKLCLQDGDDEDDEAYQNHWGLRASNGDAVPIVNRAKQLVKPGQPQAPYSGCFCDVAVEIWAQDNDFGKRINAKLKSVRFHGEGEALTADRPVNPDEIFDDYDEEEFGDDDDAGDAGDDDDDGLY
jgi:hypothetical protein